MRIEREGCSRITADKLVVLLLVLSITAFADTTGGVPSAGERILIIYTSCTDYNKELKEAFKEAFETITPAPTVDLLEIKAGDGSAPGIHDELQTTYNVHRLDDWCQVYDLRFRDDKNNQPWKGDPQEDVLTLIGPDNDYDIFKEYLSSGGSLFLQGEHHDFYIRNTNLLNFVNDVAVTPISQTMVDITVERVKITDFSAVIENFNTDFNSLTGGTIEGNYVGSIKKSNLGSAHALTSVPNGAVAIFYYPEGLKTDMGRMVVLFESNAFAEEDLQSDVSQKWIQNCYDLLSGCYRYELEKQFIPDVGNLHDEGLFEIRYTNSSAKPIESIRIRDSIPSCLRFLHSVPAPSGNSGNIYWWDLKNIDGGETGSVKVTFEAVSMPPCN